MGSALLLRLLGDASRYSSRGKSQDQPPPTAFVGTGLVKYNVVKTEVERQCKMLEQSNGFGTGPDLNSAKRKARSCQKTYPGTGSNTNTAQVIFCGLNLQRYSI